MLKIKRVAITGSLASGKTTVCNFFQEWGACVVSADALLHQAFSCNSSIRQRVCRLFGDTILEEESINRSKIAEIVQHSPDLLEQLETICHPYVNQEIQKRYKEVCDKGDHFLFVAEMPLLFESRHSFKEWFDVTILVFSSEKQARQRYLEKGGTAEQFEFRESRRMSLEEKNTLVNYTLPNNGSLELLKRRAKVLFKKLTKTF